jgi:hypothetical protein
MNALLLRVRTAERASISRTPSSATVHRPGKETSASSVSAPELPYPRDGRNWDLEKKQSKQKSIQGVFESCADILTTSYWLHVELVKNILKILCQKRK